MNMLQDYTMKMEIKISTLYIMEGITAGLYCLLSDFDRLLLTRFDNNFASQTDKFTYAQMTIKNSAIVL